MKRASLSAVPPTPKAEAPDLTDRLLGDAAQTSPPHAAAPRPRAPARNSAVKPPAPRPAEKRGKPAKTPGPRRARDSHPAPPEGPTASGPSAPSIPSVDQLAAPLDRALAQVEQAVQALTSAASEAPSRYDLAVRYRLDALKHHLQQIAEFIEITRQH